MIGDPTTFTKGPLVNEANLMIARCGNPEALPPPPSIFKISSFANPPTPIDVVIGDIVGPVGIAVHALVINAIVDTITNYICPTTNWVGILNHTGIENLVGFKNLTGPEIISANKAQFGAEARIGSKCTIGAQVINGPLIVNGPFMVNGNASWSSSIVGTTKKFDIQHPTKGSGYRLAHGCLEGPEFGVYCRGKLKDVNVIELPDYWVGLVDPETIDVSLTPFGSYQELYIDSIQWGKRIVVKNSSGGPINCSYIVYGERMDVERMVVEYEGNVPKEYVKEDK